MKLIVTFLLILTPILFAGVYIYNWISESTKEDISRTTRSQITSYLSDLENEVERMKLLQFGALDDTDVNKLAILSEAMGTIEKTERIKNLWNRLYAIHNSSPFIKNVNAHIYPIGKTISSTNGAEQLDLARYVAIHSASGGDGAQIIELEDQLLLTAAKPFGTNSALSLFMIEIELDAEELQESLRRMNTYEGSGTLLVTKAGMKAEGDDVFTHPDTLSLLEETLVGNPEGDRTMSLGDRSYYVASADSEYLGMAVYRFIPEAVVLEPLRKMMRLAWIFVAAVLAITGIYAFFTYRFIHQPLLTLVKSFRKLEHGDLQISIEHASNDEFRYLYGRFNQMVVNLRSLIDQAYKQKILAQRAELKQLQSQINPHFLYNSFFILNTMANTGDLDGIDEFTMQLGGYFQFVTRNASDEVELMQEIQHARLYTEIQSLRFAHRIEVSFQELPEEMQSVLVPRLIVQPIIENAFEHSLERMVSDGFISVRFEEDVEEYRIVVEDNGDELTDTLINRIQSTLKDYGGQQETTGIVNIHRRLAMTFGEDSGLSVTRSELGGLKVVMRLSKGRREFHV
ncbi:histidine kinase [Paenibacillus sp. TRM 82003]|nr:histidine kinase [Paenibacillus sp. TRM 82003]